MLGNSSNDGFSRAAIPIVMPVIDAHSHHRGRSIIRKNDQVQTVTISRPSGSEIASPVEKMRLGHIEIRKQAASAVRSLRNSRETENTKTMVVTNNASWTMKTPTFVGPKNATMGTRKKG
jgi:hypothetical protein